MIPAATTGPGRAQEELLKRLHERWPEIEQAALTRLHGVSTAPERPDSDYAEGLQAAVSAALAYLLAGVERGDPPSLQPPSPVLVQARRAARNQVGVDTVVRRCFAGHSVFGDFLMQELEHCENVPPELPWRLRRTQATLFDRLLLAVGEEYSRETTAHTGSAERRRAELIERLLASEPLETAELSYELNAHHLGAVAKGPGAAEAMRELAADVDRRLLLLKRENGIVWAWFGGRDPADFEELLQRALALLPPRVCLAFGESGEGATGWRFSHRQAAAALPIALRGPEPLIRYADVVLVAAVLQDELLRTSLRKMYLEPLEVERDGAGMAYETLRAYFAADRNTASTAAILGVSRQAVSGRLRTIEERLARPLTSCSAELETALQIRDLT
jgi:PucR C-terminal helix-turn-helix domain/GGDEF-like domain